ncbi:VirB8/TrbF family protein [Vibrio parahaemolyticus]|nr:VirB8/TrbF family protein [Vibrio parahaemolyticus]
MRFFSMFIAAIAVGSTGYIGAQSKIEPYVIGVKNGEEVVGVASVQKLPTSQLEALKVNDLERFVEDIRSVYLDVEVEDKAVRRAYARLVPNSLRKRKSHRRSKKKTRLSAPRGVGQSRHQEHLATVRQHLANGVDRNHH